MVFLKILVLSTFLKLYQFIILLPAMYAYFILVSFHAHDNSTMEEWKYNFAWHFGLGILSDHKILSYRKMANGQDRVIVLVDMDCFFVQVEQRQNPHLRNKPCAVVQYTAWKGGGYVS